MSEEPLIVPQPRPKLARTFLILGVAVVLILALVSVTIGAYELSVSELLDFENLRANLVLLVSRVPRTIAIVLVGMSMGVAGMLMQMLSRNKFVSPSTAGTPPSWSTRRPTGRIPRTTTPTSPGPAGSWPICKSTRMAAAI